MGGEARSVDARGAHTTPRCDQRGPAPRAGVATSAPVFISPSDSCFGTVKIGTSAFVSSNSENISCITFLKYKNSRKQELALWHLVNRLVPKNA